MCWSFLWLNNASHRLDFELLYFSLQVILNRGLILYCLQLIYSLVSAPYQWIRHLFLSDKSFRKIILKGSSINLRLFTYSINETSSITLSSLSLDVNYWYETIQVFIEMSLVYWYHHQGWLRVDRTWPGQLSIFSNDDVERSETIFG